jgi:hypothetical protein
MMMEAMQPAPTFGVHVSTLLGQLINWEELRRRLLRYIVTFSTSLKVTVVLVVEEVKPISQQSASSSLGLL